VTGSLAGFPFVGTPPEVHADYVAINAGPETQTVGCAVTYDPTRAQAPRSVRR